MADRLEEIKRGATANWRTVQYGDIRWLLDEVDTLLAEIRRLRAQLAQAQQQPCDELRGALGDAIELADEEMYYVSEYFRDKWKLPEELARLRAILAASQPSLIATDSSMEGA